MPADPIRLCGEPPPHPGGGSLVVRAHPTGGSRVPRAPGARSSTWSYTGNPHVSLLLSPEQKCDGWAIGVRAQTRGRQIELLESGGSWPGVGREAGPPQEDRSWACAPDTAVRLSAPAPRASPHASPFSAFPRRHHRRISTRARRLIEAAAPVRPPAPPRAHGRRRLTRFTRHGGPQPTVAHNRARAATSGRPGDRPGVAPRAGPPGRRGVEGAEAVAQVLGQRVAVG